MRKPNEVRVSPELLERMLAKSSELHRYEIKEGPAGDAKIVGVRFDHAQKFIVLEYDQEVVEPLLVATYEPA